MELPFVVYSILKQCWRVGYVSFLTLSFIIYAMMGLLIYKYELLWQEVSVKSLIPRWPLRPVGLLFFLRITPVFNLEIGPKWKILLKQFVSTTPLKPLNRISRNIEVMKDLMCRCAYPQEILIQFFFLGVMPLCELINLTKIKIKIQ